MKQSVNLLILASISFVSIFATVRATSPHATKPIVERLAALEQSLATTQNELAATKTKLANTERALNQKINANKSSSTAALTHLANLKAVPNKYDAKTAKGIRAHDGKWGDWTGVKMVPAGHYVAGLKVRFEKHQGGAGDDTALNAVELVCLPIPTK